MQLVAGRITKPHGIRGEVAVDVRTDDPDGRFVVGATLETDRDEIGPLQVASVRSHQGRLLIRFEGHTDRNSVEALVGVHLLVEPDPQRHEDEFYDHELVGLEVVDPTGAPIGTLRTVFHNPGNDLLEVTRPDAEPVLVPFVSSIVIAVNLRSGRLVLDAPPGLLGPIED